MITQLAHNADENQIHRIAMGCGGEAFKNSLASGTRTYFSGTIDSRPVTRFATRGWMAAKELIRDTPLEAAARTVFRQLQQAKTIIAPALRDA